MQGAPCTYNNLEMDFFSDYGDANRFKIQEVIGKGNYGVVGSAIDTLTDQQLYTQPQLLEEDNRNL
ncbi:hypothetical protein HID58_092981 [Brassica napus]|uniref:Mitogen-activated protein kinase n=1 Tax=Brassica napus TaxID=3708 RepID=A0ABQ7XEM7_BRANA|nr:hypothetical protein HID58_092981 [Brassica napus]